MKIYIAAPYELRPEAINVMRQLEALGHTITSRWLREIIIDDCEAAEVDLEDIDRANQFLLLHPKEWHLQGTGGRHVEFGYALLAGKELVLLGAPSNIFHHLDYVRVIQHLEDL